MRFLYVFAVCYFFTWAAWELPDVARAKFLTFCGVMFAGLTINALYRFFLEANRRQVYWKTRALKAEIAYRRLSKELENP